MMIVDNLRFPVTLFAALGCGLVAGIFFAFSTFVMNALARLEPKEGITAMQSINITAINPLFMVALFGTATACILLGIDSILKWHQPSATYLLIGSLLYLIGTILVTIAFNVPLNDALAIAKPDSVEGANLWARYLTNWTFWNHVRTVAALAAATAFTIALCNQTLSRQ
ncbi:DUF1772 domain-containing protein [Halotia branconii]|uniref:DUF1772 domain-containing protein n=1 Tax=Halotia branconii CENA392 TaxID=1539056 RepID=A0AAJ6PB33_9CYAN|nr:anthrone oxygenase family protein [Halotia branconii]WGV27346.1 DUF1772 domain-containing protein [Halotia branconii CENA392]